MFIGIVRLVTLKVRENDCVFQEELRISSVYSVGGGNAFAVPPSKSAYFLFCGYGYNIVNLLTEHI